MRSSRVLAISTLVGAVFGCTADPEEPVRTFEEACALVDGCGTPRLTGPAELVYRIELERTDGAFAFGEIRTIEVLEDGGTPIGPLGGRFTLSGRDSSGADIDGQWLSFPERIEFERADVLGDRISYALTGKVRTIGFVRVSPEVTTFAVVDQMDGSVVAEAPIPTEPPSDLAIGVSRSGLIRATSRPACGHIVVLEQGGLTGIPLDGVSTDITFEAPGPMQLAVVDAALGRMTEMNCHGLARIGFSDLRHRPDLGGFVWGGRVGDLAIINTGREHDGVLIYKDAALAESVENRVRMMSTVVHESGHALDHLFTSAAAGINGDGAWVRSSKAWATERIDNIRIRNGMHTEWVRMHESFIAQGWAAAYPGNVEAARAAGLATFTAEATANAGAMSRYGMTNSYDDIADAVAWTLLADDFAAAGFPDGPMEKEDFACQAMATFDGVGIPSRYAAIFAKLMFLRDLDVVWDDDVERCLGTVGYDDVPVGFQFTIDREVRQTYTTAVAGGLGVETTTGRHTFLMRADGNAIFGGVTYPATAELRLDLADPAVAPELVSWPRGVYRFVPGSPHSFTLRLPDAPAGNFDVTDGWILIGESNSEKIRGSIFVAEAFRLNAPVPVPQVFDPPLLVQVHLVP